MGYATFRYRMGKDGTIESKIFDSDNVPLPSTGWWDSPAKCLLPEGYESETGLETREELIMECEKRGIDFDRRWGIFKLKAALGIE